jgi:hypothetical protein
MKKHIIHFIDLKEPFIIEATGYDSFVNEDWICFYKDTDLVLEAKASMVRYIVKYDV